MTKREFAHTQVLDPRESACFLPALGTPSPWPPEIIYRFTGIRKRVLRLWKRPFWFSKKVNVAFSSNWVVPYQGGCSQVLISSKKFWFVHLRLEKRIFHLLWEIFLPSHWIFLTVDFWCVHRFQLLKVCTQYDTLPNSPAYRAYPRNTFFPNWWILDWSFAEMV